ncbi:MAG: nucleotidyltransferase [Bacilli bacterium]
MNIIGIIAEYNPFHNGHLYHLDYIKEKYKDSVIIAVVSSNFVQRGSISIISKWEKTKICLEYGVDIVLELPFVFANESADFFAINALKILSNFKVDTIIFGSECGDSSSYTKYANIQLNNTDYANYVKKNLANGFNFPTSSSLALKEICGEEVNLPNDILGLAYTKAIIKNSYDIKIETIKRTNSYHSLSINKISSATSIRKAIQSGVNYDICVPDFSKKILKNSRLYSNADFFIMLKYKIISSTVEELAAIHLVEEGIEYRIKKMVSVSYGFDSLVKNISSKRYTYARVSRLLFNILINYKKKDRIDIQNQNYFRVLGFNKKGQKYLKILKNQNIKFSTNIKNINNYVSYFEYRVSSIIKIIDSSYEENKIIIKEEL